jgi:predicted nucleic acid-binding protein
VIIVDASAIIAGGNRSDVNHAVASSWLQNERGGIIAAPVTAEIDYMLSSRGFWQAARNFVVDVSAGRFRVECLLAEEYLLLLSLMDRYADLAPGLSDLSMVVLAHRFQTNRILTFDQRHFRALTPLAGGAFSLVPFDEPLPADA